MNKKLAVLAAMLIAGAAFAVVEQKYDVWAKFNPHLFIKGFYVGPEIGTNKVQTDTQNKVTAVRQGCFSQDFPAIGGKSDSTLALCADSIAQTITGVKVRDTCFATTNFGEDGGSNLDVAVSLNCYVSAPNAVKFRICAHMSDAGSINLADGGFCATVISNQVQ